jgi:hypothetical protein
MRRLVLAAFLLAPLLMIGAAPASACSCCPCGYGCSYGPPTIVYTPRGGPYYGPPRACLGDPFDTTPTWGWRAFQNGVGWRGNGWSRGYGYRGGWRNRRMGWRGGR